MTKVLTAFDSESPQSDSDEARKLEQKYDYVQVFEALIHNQEVAENVFARCAKKHFRSLLDEDNGLKLVMPEDAKDLSPVWMTDSRIILATATETENEASKAALFIILADELKTLVSLLAEGVKAQKARRENVSLAMIGPLSTKISEVGEGLHSFTVKQRWSVHA